MSDKPIIFSGPMIRALLDGRKTQTRRALKVEHDRPQTPWPEAKTFAAWHDGPDGLFHKWFHDSGAMSYAKVPIRAGDRLWVREQFGISGISWGRKPSAARGGRVHYLADCDHGWHSYWGKTHPSIHMPRWASRLTLTVTDVRVQRLQDISEADALAEGVKEVSEEWPGATKPAYQAYGQTACYGGPGSSRLSFMSLWNSIHGPAAWDDNPWVAAYTFTVQLGNIDEAKQ